MPPPPLESIPQPPGWDPLVRAKERCSTGPVESRSRRESRLLGGKPVNAFSMLSEDHVEPAGS